MPHENRLAVLIDADNVGASFAPAIFREVAKLGNPDIRRAYANGHHKKWLKVVPTVKIETPRRLSKKQGKNSTDINLVVAAMDLLHEDRDLAGICVVGSDSDYTGLVERLRKDKKLVYGFGNRTTPARFRNACSKFFKLENLMKPAPSPPREPQPDAAQRELLREAGDQISEAVREVGNEDGWANLSQVGAHLRSRIPPFVVRRYGHKKLVDLVKKTGQFETRRPAPKVVEIKRK